MSDSTSMPADRVRIFDRDGAPLAEFRALVERSWMIGQEGRAAFDYPIRKTDVVNETVLQFGNYLLVENDKLPSWVGVIDTPRDWSTRVVTVAAYTCEHVFSWRIGPQEEKITASAGTVFTRLLNLVNAAEETRLRRGDIWKGGTQREETLNPTLLSEDLRRIAERSLEEYQFRPVIKEGALIIFCDWMEQLGVDTGAFLHEGIGGGNVEAVGTILVEDGPILNEVFAYGDGETWQSKPTITVTNAPSVAAYGLRQGSEEFSGVIDKKTLEDNARAKLRAARQPLRTFRLNALDVGGTYSYLSLGNRLTLQFEDVGFYRGAQGYKTDIRIVGMSYNPDTPKRVELVVEEIL